jgi:hypothetical protein
MNEKPTIETMALKNARLKEQLAEAKEALEILKTANNYLPKSLHEMVCAALAKLNETKQQDTHENHH